MKKLIYVIFAMIMVFALASCGSSSSESEDGSSEKELVRKYVLSGDEDDVDMFDSFIIGMNSSDRTYFTASYDGGVQGVESSHCNMYAVDETLFNETSPIDPWQFSDLITEAAETFLNSSYDNAPSYGNLFCDSMADRTIDALFGGSVSGYFNDHKLSLSCEEASIEQVAVYEQNEHYSYIFGVSVNVKTESCTGDMSDLGFFADNGENKEVVMYMVCTYWDEEDEITLSYLNIK